MTRLILGVGALLAGCRGVDTPKDGGPADTGSGEAGGLFPPSPGAGWGAGVPNPPGRDSATDTAVDSGGETGETGETGGVAETGDTSGRPPSTMWVQVSQGSAAVVAAALTDNGSLACWGVEGVMEFNCPVGYFTQIAQGDVHGCGLDEAGQITCWGGGVGEFSVYNLGQLKPPPGRYERIASGRLQSCALDAAGALTCWGCDDCGYTLPTGGPYDEVSIGFGWGCVLTESGEIACWGDDYFGEQDAPEGTGWHGLATGAAHGCVLDADGYPTCWGGSDPGVVDDALTDVQFRSISAGAESVCGVTYDDEIRCWESIDAEGGDYGNLDREAPAGSYQSVVVGDQSACALSTAGEIECFGNRRRVMNEIPDLPE